MNQIEIYIKKTRHKAVPPFYSHSFDRDQSSLYRPALDSIKAQIKELGVTASVDLVDVQDIPVKTNAFLLCILDENSLIADDYIARILSTNNLHRDMAMVCGPVLPVSKNQPLDWFVLKIADTYKKYDLKNFSSFISTYINGDYQNYPSIEGCIFSGRHYNEMGGYRPVITPRFLMEKNYDFLSGLDRIGPLVYSERLSTLYYVNPEELEMNNFSKFYYCMGYYDALCPPNAKSYNSVVLALEFVDNDSAYADKTDSDRISKYGNMLTTLKCIYEVGFTEAKTNNKIL